MAARAADKEAAVSGRRGVSITVTPLVEVRADTLRVGDRISGKWEVTALDPGPALILVTYREVGRGRHRRQVARMEHDRIVKVQPIR